MTKLQKQNKIGDKEKILKYFGDSVVEHEEGIDYDDDGYPYDYFAIIIQANGKVNHPADEFGDSVEDNTLVNSLNYYEGFDYHLDRGLYFGKANISKNQYEVRFWKCLY